jgi:hypothetical protein
MGFAKKYKPSGCRSLVTTFRQNKLIRKKDFIGIDKEGVKRMSEILKRIEKLEFQQKLLLEMIPVKGFEFYRLVIRKGLSEEDVNHFFELCEKLNKHSQEQKAEGFVFFAPLFNEFTEKLDPRLSPEEVIKACIAQKLFPFLMDQLKRNL